MKNGYIVLDHFISKQKCDQINRDLEDRLAAGEIRYDFKGQHIEKMFEHSKATRELCSVDPGDHEDLIGDLRRPGRSLPDAQFHSRQPAGRSP